MAYGMLIDLKKCVGCHACATACKGAHGTPPGVTRSHVERSFEGTYPDARKTILPASKRVLRVLRRRGKTALSSLIRKCASVARRAFPRAPMALVTTTRAKRAILASSTSMSRSSMRKICLQARSTNARSAPTELMRAKARSRLASRHARRELEFSAISKR